MLVTNIFSFSKTKHLSINFFFISGAAQVKAVSIPSNIFVTTGGSLTLGQLTPGLSVAISMGTFTGYIDEVRIWSRPHNPTIITQNFRVVVTTETYDVSYSWNFNEGIGLIGYDMNKYDNMVVTDYLNPPIWRTSDLDLTDYVTLDVPQLTTLDELNAATVSDTNGTCNNLLQSFSLSVTGSSVALLTDVYKALCFIEAISSGDTTQIDALLASISEFHIQSENSSTNPLASMCNNLTSLDSYIGAEGGNCTLCVFGDVVNGVCECDDSYWGTSCDQVCPIGPSGGCSSVGTCSSSGTCNCHARYQGAGFSVQIYWSNYVSITSTTTSLTYVCDTCSDNWVGQDCEYGQTTKLTDYSVGIVYGIYVTALDGISFLHVASGVFTLVKTSTVEVQVLFVPCLGYSDCRYVQEIAFKSGSTQIYAQHLSNSEWHVYADGSEIMYPMEVTYGIFTVSWNETDLYVRVTFGSSAILIHNSDVGIVVYARVGSSESAVTTGLLGNSDGSWTNDLNCQTGTVVTDPAQMTATYSTPCLRSRYSPAQSDVFITHTYSIDPPTSGGYKVQLVNQDLNVTGMTYYTGLSVFTLTLWSMSASTATSYTILEVDTGTSVLQFTVDSGVLILNWDGSYNTTLTYTENKWHYIALSWSKDGSTYMFIIKDGVVHSKVFNLIHSTSTISFKGLTVSGTAHATVSVDLVRSWSLQKSLSEILTDMDMYPGDESETSLMAVLALDEGNGSTVILSQYNSDGTITSIEGSISGRP